MSALIGVLALQGGFAAHLAALARAGLPAREVRAPADLDGVTGLVLPGGESTVQWKLIGRLGLEAPLRALAARGAPVLGTCAGLILATTRFGWLDVTVERNAWGRQIHSFEGVADDGERRLVFIRGPRIMTVGSAARVLATFRGEPVLVRQGNVVGAAYHPELVSSELHAELFHRGIHATNEQRLLLDVMPPI